MKSIRHDHLEQGSDEWHDFRRQYLTASVAAVVMGCAPKYWGLRTTNQLRGYRDGTWTPPEVSEFARKFMDAGLEIEERAILAAGLDGLSDLKPEVLSKGIYAASLDAASLDSGVWLEVKRPKASNSKTWVLANSYGAIRSRVPVHYWWQLVHQAYVLPDHFNACQYVVFLEGRPPVTIGIPREELLADWPILEGAWERFLDPDMTNTAVSDDERLARDYISLEAEFAVAKERLDKAKAALLRDGPRIIPGLLEIKRSPVKGRINYRKAAESFMTKEELDSFRDEGSERANIKHISEA